MVKRTGAYSQTAWEVRQQEREAKWRGHLSSWQSSGLSQAEYCRRKNLTPADFSWWKHELARRDGRAKPPAPQDSPTFVPVKLAAAGHSAGCGCEVVLRNGRCLRIGVGVSAQWAAELAAALEGHAP